MRGASGRDKSRPHTECEPSSRELDAHHLHQLAYGIGRLAQSGLFLGRQLQLDDLFDALRAELGRHADEQPVDAVLAFEIDARRAGCASCRARSRRSSASTAAEGA